MKNQFHSTTLQEFGTFHEYENRRAAVLPQLRAHLRMQQGGGDKAAALPVLLAEGQFVEVTVTAKGPLGYAVMVDKTYEGLIYHNGVCVCACARMCVYVCGRVCACVCHLIREGEGSGRA
jgi:hypothetical protein